MIIGEQFLDIDPQRWDNLMSVNVRGPYLCCRYVLPVMIKQRSGSVVNIGSGMGGAAIARRRHRLQREQSGPTYD